MKTANHEFAILPWEYRGTNFAPSPHAVTSLDFNGQKRDFLLKMRDGIIYFKEPKGKVVFAVLRHFDRELRGEELTSAWRTEVESENFGQFSWRSTIFMGCLANTVIVSATRPDYSGWISDAFHINWHEVPKHRDGMRLDITKANANMRHVTWRAINRTRPTLVDRAISETECQSLPSHWARGGKAELQRVLALITRLYIRRGNEVPKRRWYFEATNMASPGGLRGYLTPLDQSYNKGLQISPFLRPLIKVLDDNFVWTKMDWQHHTSSASPDGLLNDMETRWGTRWRGNYSFSTPQFTLEAPLVASVSHHERLELSLQLREWLQDKVPSRQIERWLSQIPD